MMFLSFGAGKIGNRPEKSYWNPWKIFSNANGLGELPAWIFCKGGHNGRIHVSQIKMAKRAKKSRSNFFALKTRKYHLNHSAPFFAAMLQEIVTKAKSKW